MRTKKLLNASYLLVFAILLLNFNNCSRPISFGQDGALSNLPRFQGIIVGNPMSSKTLLANICSTISTCHSHISEADCEAGVLKTTGIAFQLGIPKGTMNLYSDIVQAESGGSLHADAIAVSSCTSAIQQLTCSDSLVQKAYDPLASDPFAGVAFMIPTTLGSCPAVFSQPPARTEYYVATTGSDLNDGSASKPWATITHADQSLVVGAEGATVHVAPGNYSPPTSSCVTPTNPTNSCGILTLRSGTASAPITYVSDQLWGAKIIPLDAYSAWYNLGDYVSIVGFEIIGNSATNIGIQSDGSFVRIESNQVHDIPVTSGCSSGIGGGGISHTNPSAHDNDSIANVVHDIGPFPGNNLAPSNYCNHAHGIYHHQPRGHIHNNLIYRVGSWGIVTWATSSNLQITNNLIFNSGAKDNLSKFWGGGIAIAADAAVHDYTTVSNNIIRNNSGAGLNDGQATGTHNVFLNNVLYANGNNFAFKPGTVDVGSILVDPMMVNFTMDGSGNYRLQSGSPAIDTGTSSCASGSGCTPDKDYSGFLRPYGAGIDVGPFEWHP